METYTLLIPEGYETPTDDDIKRAKRWTLLRNRNAAVLSDRITEILQDAIREMVRIAYKYNCTPENFQFSQDKKLREDIAALLSEMEDEIMELVEIYSLNETADAERRSLLLPWLAALSSKGNKGLKATLHARVRQFMYDTEAQIAAMKLAGYGQTKATNRSVSTMHAVYTAPEVLAAFKRKSAAMYINSHGTHYGNVGLSSSGANNVESFGRQTATIAWMKSQLLDFVDRGAAGYYQMRGSAYECDICDSQVGLHIGNFVNDLYPHNNCMCFRVPVWVKEGRVTTRNTTNKTE
jgi:hypothetical protein